MMDRFCKWDVKKTGIFAAGVLFGTAGIKVLSSKDAKKVYVFSTAAVLRAKECIMRTVSIVRENAEDIYEEALEANEKKAAEEMSPGTRIFWPYSSLAGRRMAVVSFVRMSAPKRPSISSVWFLDT